MNHTAGENELQEKLSTVSKCPFLNEVTSAIKELKQDDVIEVNQETKPTTNATFAYDDFFHEQIMKKKKEHSYRIFKKVNRLAGAGQFPKALEYTSGEKPITVWCSNDYLGMSCHPVVKNEVSF